MECKICNKKIVSFNGLAVHIRFKHKDLGSEGYYNLFLKKDPAEGICKNPKCNNQTSFITISSGYLHHCCNRCSTLDPKTQNKMKNTSMENHGVEHALQSKEIFKKMEDDNLKKYGKKNVMKIKENSKKGSETCLKKYGVKCSLLLPLCIEKNSANKKNKFVSKETGLKISKANKGGKKSAEFKQKRRVYMLNGGASYCNKFIKNPSKPQISLFNIVKEIFSTAILNYQLKEVNRSLDVAIPQLKIVFEYDGSYWHPDSKKDNERQTQIENLGWKFIKYCDYIPAKDQIIKDMNKFLFI